MKKNIITPEKVIHRQFKEYLDWRKIPYIHSRMDCRTTVQKGVADFIVCKNGKFIAIEIKTKKGKLIREQLNFLRQIERSNGVATICRTYEECIGVIEKYDDRKD